MFLLLGEPGGCLHWLILPVLSLFFRWYCPRFVLFCFVLVCFLLLGAPGGRLQWLLLPVCSHPLCLFLSCPVMSSGVVSTMFVFVRVFSVFGPWPLRCGGRLKWLYCRFQGGQVFQFEF